ncbi:MAG: hypothetical protein KDK07_25785, partial [Bauldia sp.]|nr:hypothetical protein [Bauldia sp.]
GLKILADGVILKSEASLVASRTARWTDRQRKTLSEFLGRLDPKAARRAERLLGAAEPPLARPPAVARGATARSQP